VTTSRLFILIGSILGFLGVAAGAFGAHALKSRLSPDLLAVFETGARYQLIHAVALLAVAALMTQLSSGAVRASGWLFISGSLIFSGSLYALALSGVRILGAVTPVGGLLLLAGWIALALGAAQG
jgi:uncharacterized membrane protein YgdD (TMEM256/DUF423 family)